MMFNKKELTSMFRGLISDNFDTDNERVEFLTDTLAVMLAVDYVSKKQSKSEKIDFECYITEKIFTLKQKTKNKLLNNIHFKNFLD